MTTNSSTQGADADAAAAASPASSGPAKKETPNPYSLRLFELLFRSQREEPLGEFPLPYILFRFAIVAPIMLLGLPLGALAIVHLSDCCSNESVVSFFTFWSSVLAAMLALFGMLIAAVFVITALRIDKNAKVEAQAAAVEAVQKFLLMYKRGFLQQIDEWLHQVKLKKKDAIECIETAKTKVETEKDDAIGCIKTAKGKVETEKDKAVKSIEAEKQATELKRQAATSAIDEARKETDEEAKQAKEAMTQAARDVETERDTVVRRIGDKETELNRYIEDAKARIAAEVAEVERLAAEARTRLEGQQGEDPTPKDPEG